MKNRTLEILLIILLVDILLVSISFAPEIDISFPFTEGLKIKFPRYNYISDFRYNDNRKTADSLINAYLVDSGTINGLIRRTSLTGIEPKIKNNFLTNIENEKIYALDNFFKSLLKQKDSGIVRIAHYGDSQVEGDRITCYVRSNFQKKFGGSGVGFVPFEEIADNVNLVRVSSPNWIRYTVFHNHYSNEFYGLSGNVYKFSKYAVIKNDKGNSSKNDEKDTIQKFNKNKIYNNATISITFRSWVNYNHISLLYGHTFSSCSMEIYNLLNNEKILSETLEPSEEFTIHKLGFPSSVKSFKLEFSGNISPDFYGLLVDGSKGVQVDNYAIRGHSGDGLLLINPEYLATQLKKLNVKLVIFQYGNNMVPYINSDEKCKRAEDIFYNIFTRFKNAAPGISILAIGAGDMATMLDGTYVSYPYIPKIRDAQKNAAIRAGCAFWDLFEVTGGANSIIAWKEKGLATSYDGHFTKEGQKIIGKELFNAIMIEYNQYKYRQRKKENL